MLREIQPLIEFPVNEMFTEITKIFIAPFQRT